MSFLEARQALDRSLASHAWTDRDAVAAAVRRHLVADSEEQNVSTGLSPSSNVLGESNKGNILSGSNAGGAGVDAAGKQARRARFSEKFVEARTRELIDVLDSLRTAGEANLESLALSNESIREDGVDCGDDRQWRLKEEGKEHRVLYRKGPEGTPLHEICLEGIIHGPLDTLLAVVWEVPFFKDWWPQFSVPPFKVLESKFAHRIAPGLELSYLQFKSPWPFATRELLFFAFMVQDTATGLFVASVHSPPDDISHMDPETAPLHPSAMPAVAPGCVRMTVGGGFAGQDLGGGRCYFRGACTLDMKFDLMPPWLINFVARQLAGTGYHLLCHEVDTIVKAAAAAATVNKCDKKKGRGAFQQLLASDPVYMSLRKAMEEYRRGKAEEGESRREGSEEEGRSLRELGEKVEEEVERLVSSLSKRESVLGPEEAEEALLQLEAAAASAVALTRPSVEPPGSQARDRSGSRSGSGLGAGGAAGMAASEASAAAATILAAASAAANVAEGPPSASTSFSSVTQTFSSGPLPLARHGGLEAGEGMASLLRESSSVRSGPLPSIRTVTGSTSSGSYGVIANLRAGEIPDMLNSSCSVTSSRSSFACGDSASASGSSSQSSSGSSSPSSYPGLYHRDPAIFRAVATLDKAILFVRARAAAAAAAEAGPSDPQGDAKHEKHVTSMTAATGTKREAFSCSPSQQDGFQEEVVLGDGETGNNALSSSSVGPVKSAARPVTVTGESGGSDEDTALGCLDNGNAGKAGKPKDGGKRVSLSRIGKRFFGMRFSRSSKVL